MNLKLPEIILKTINPEKFEKEQYYLQTINYFNPHEECFVSEEDFIKILKGNVTNPHKLNNPKTTTDYDYFIISNQGLEELNEKRKRKFEGNMVMKKSLFRSDDEDPNLNLCYRSQWFGLFSVESDSSIIIPNQIEFIFNSKRKMAIKQEKKTSAWNGGGRYQLDKNEGTNLLISNLTQIEIENLMKEIYTNF